MKNLKNKSLTKEKKKKMIKKILGLTLKFIKMSKGKSHGVIMKTQRGKLREKMKIQHP